MPTEPFKTAPLSPSCLYQAEYERTPWRVKVPEGISPEVLMQPNYWAHVAGRFRPMALIEAYAENGSWYAEFIVVDCASTWAKLALKFPVVQLHQEVATDDVPDGYDIAWKGPMLKWCVIRKTDNQRIYEKAADKAAALVQLSAHMKKVA